MARSKEGEHLLDPPSAAPAGKGAGIGQDAGHPHDVRRYLSNPAGAQHDPAFYERLAETEPNADLAAVYRRRLNRSANTWPSGRTSWRRGATVPPFRLPWRTRILQQPASAAQAGFVLLTIEDGQALRSRGGGDGQLDAEAAGLPQHERSHARIFRQLSRTRRAWRACSGLVRGTPPRASGRARRRAGANDGPGVRLQPRQRRRRGGNRTILLTGSPGYVRRASMALGEWLSVQSSPSELYQHQIDIEREHRPMPGEEKAELALIYQAKWCPLIARPGRWPNACSRRDHRADTRARSSTSIRPSAARHGPRHHCSFRVLGAIIPCSPTLLVRDHRHRGQCRRQHDRLGLCSDHPDDGRNALYSGLPVAPGLAAAAITFGVGALIGVNVAG